MRRRSFYHGYPQLVPSERPHRALVIESDDQVLATAEGVLRREGLEVVSTHGLREAAALLRETQEPFDVLILESDPASTEERRLLRTLRRDSAGAMAVLFVVHGDRPGFVGPDETDVLLAPFGAATLRDALVRNHALQR